MFHNTWWQAKQGLPATLFASKHICISASVGAMRNLTPATLHMATQWGTASMARLWMACFIFPGSSEASALSRCVHSFQLKSHSIKNHGRITFIFRPSLELPQLCKINLAETTPIVVSQDAIKAFCKYRMDADRTIDEYFLICLDSKLSSQLHLFDVPKVWIILWPPFFFLLQFLTGNDLRPKKK